ncbi:exported protein of unknown function [Modestobacter italicus]|uniref:Fibronectin type-III domain-containing protein n=1 Tax=Modestobacter italicus (strain DSM 44449 / CECT 9708 / BC 501) TaxID=2732864 RepID=I4EQX5_MODI5|nr:fibronectin type III domain-containing protein [Modestobacter marinus]CCH85788.1 exported protein of unknown function [Modestobacter marinus]
MSIKSPARRWSGLLAVGTIAASTAVMSMAGVAQAAPTTTTDANCGPVTSDPAADARAAADKAAAAAALAKDAADKAGAAAVVAQDAAKSAADASVAAAATAASAVTAAAAAQSAVDAAQVAYDAAKATYDAASAEVALAEQNLATATEDAAAAKTASDNAAEAAAEAEQKNIQSHIAEADAGQAYMDASSEAAIARDNAQSAAEYLQTINDDPSSTDQDKADAQAAVESADAAVTAAANAEASAFQAAALASTLASADYQAWQAALTSASELATAATAAQSAAETAKTAADEAAADAVAPKAAADEAKANLDEAKAAKATADELVTSTAATATAKATAATAAATAADTAKAAADKAAADATASQAAADAAKAAADAYDSPLYTGGSSSSAISVIAAGDCGTEVPGVVVAAPVNVKASVGTSSINVTWDAPADTTGIAGYEVFALPGAEPQSSAGLVTCVVDADGRACLLGVEAGQQYTVGVHAFDTEGNLGESGEFIVTGVVPAPTVAKSVPAGNAELKSKDGSVDKVTAGQKMTFVGSGYLPFSTVTLVVYSEPQVVGTVVADENGNFTVDVTIPANLVNGEHSLVATGVDANGNPYVLRADFTVSGGVASSAQPGGLAYTGASIALPMLGGLTAVGVGGGLLVAARRRKNA